MIKNGATKYFEQEQKVPYIVNGDQWVGYDDENSLKLKVGLTNVCSLHLTTDHTAQGSVCERSYKHVLVVYYEMYVKSQGNVLSIH